MRDKVLAGPAGQPGRTVETLVVEASAVDLGGSASFADVPGEVLAALLTDVIGRRCQAGEGPSLAAWLTSLSPESPRLGAWL